MKISEALESGAKAARRHKEAHVKDVKGKPGRTDINTFIQLYRGHEPIAMLSCRPDRDLMLNAMWGGIMGFGADVVCWTSESWTVGREHAAINPVTGKEWEPGEIGQVALEHDGLAKGWVFEGLITGVANRAGDFDMAEQRYRIEGRRVVWLPSEERPEETEKAGVVPDAVREMMRRPTLLDQMTRELGVTLQDVMGDMSWERKMFHHDMGIASGLREKLPQGVFMALYLKPGTLRHQLARERAGASPQGFTIIDPRDHQ